MRPFFLLDCMKIRVILELSFKNFSNQDTIKGKITKRKMSLNFIFYIKQFSIDLTKANRWKNQSNNLVAFECLFSDTV